MKKKPTFGGPSVIAILAVIIMGLLISLKMDAARRLERASVSQSLPEPVASAERWSLPPTPTTDTVAGVNVPVQPVAGGNTLESLGFSTEHGHKIVRE